MIDLKAEIENYFDRLWPLDRSITGDGLRDSLQILGEINDLDILEIPSGKSVFDWIVPEEWNVKEAYIVCPSGERICDFSVNNLHLIGYSRAFNSIMTLAELKPFLFTIPELPDAIPYLTSYYSDRWGFCLTHRQYERLQEGDYKVVVDTTHHRGSMSIAEAVSPGSSSNEILLSTYMCHPSMAVNELSGPLVASFLFRLIRAMPGKHYTYRLVVAPETIGPIAYLNEFKDRILDNTVGGFVITCVGSDDFYNYKRSRRKSSLIDKVTEHVLMHKATGSYQVRDFIPIGSDERQYCSPGFNLAVGSLMRTVYGEYKEYHTSLDDKSLLSFSAMAETVSMYENIIKSLEINHCYISTNPYCEPRLGTRGLYPTMGLREHKDESLRKILYILNYSDGNNSLLEIAVKLDCYILDLEKEVNILLKNNLIKIPED